MVGNKDKQQWSKVTNNLYYFYRVFVGSKFAENLPAPHIKTLSKELTKMSNGGFKRLCVAMPPSSFKIKPNYFGLSNVEIISKSKP